MTVLVSNGITVGVDKALMQDEYENALEDDMDFDKKLQN